MFITFVLIASVIFTFNCFIRMWGYDLVDTFASVAFGLLAIWGWIIFFTNFNMVIPQ